MMMFSRWWFGALALIACNEGPVKIDSVCRVHPTQQTEAKECLVQCAEAANPMSDEEGEDLVTQCEESCTNIYCWSRWRYLQDGRWWDCRKGLANETREACLNAGWKPDE